MFSSHQMVAQGIDPTIATLTAPPDVATEAAEVVAAVKAGKSSEGDEATESIAETQIDVATTMEV